jgi:taurine dioxygenase
MNTIDAKPLHPFGAELEIDLAAPLSQAEQKELRELFAEHDLLLLHDQRLTLDDQTRVMGYLGDVLPTPEGRGQIRHDNGLHTSALAFHSDLAFSPEPLRALSLQALQVGDTSTRFANARQAYGRLSAEQLEAIADRDALHVWPTDLSRRNRDADVAPEYPRSRHPVTRREPDRAPILFVCENSTDSLSGLPADESEALIAELFEVLYSPEFIFEHHWRAGDLIIWDNLAVQHGRSDIAAHGDRILQRVALGRVGIAEQHPELAAYFR